MSEITVREAGVKGGTVRRDGGADYAAMGKKGGRETLGRRGHEFYQEIGRRGGAATAATHDRAHYQAMGAKGGAAGKGRRKVRQKDGNSG